MAKTSVKRRTCVILGDMSTQATEKRIPVLTLGWRLKMSLGDMPVEEMAVYLDTSRQTISRWMADKGKPPKPSYIRDWASKTDTDLDWLMTGEGEPGPTPGPGEVAPKPAAKNNLAKLTAAKRRRGVSTAQYFHGTAAEAA